MTRFAKEMKKRFPYAFCEDPYTGEKSGYVIEEEALVVFCHPSMTIVLRFLRRIWCICAAAMKPKQRAF